MADFFANSPDQEENQQLKKITALLIDNWKLFAVCVVAFVLLGWLYTKYATPKYKVDSAVLVQDEEKGGNIFGTASSILQNFSGILGLKSNVDNEAQIFQTRDLMELVSIDLKLYITYYSVGILHSTELYKSTPIKL